MITNAYQESKTPCLVEVWAANLGSDQERKQGRRTLEFSSDLWETVDQVKNSLDAIMEVVNLAASEGWCENRVDGLSRIVELVTSSAARVIDVMSQKYLNTQRQLDELKQQKHGPQEQSIPVSLLGNPEKHSELDALSLRYCMTYAGFEAHALGLLLVDMLSAEARENLIMMIMDGKPIDEIKKQVGCFEMSENLATD